MTFVVIGLLVLNIALMAFVALHVRGPKEDSTGALLIKQDLTNLSDSVTKLQDGLQTQLNDRLDKSNSQMLKQFAQSTDIIKDITAKLTSLEKTNQQVGNIANDLKTLQNVLQNPKQRGVLGEYYLNQVHFRQQLYHFELQ